MKTLHATQDRTNEEQEEVYGKIMCVHPALSHQALLYGMKS